MMNPDNAPLPTTEANHEPTIDRLSSSITSASYKDSSTNDLTVLTSALLLTADCMGTGILALPGNVQTLGTGAGLAFLALNLPLNLYAGTILGRCALFVEETILGASRLRREENLFEVQARKDGAKCSNASSQQSTKHDGDAIGRKRYRRGYSSVRHQEFHAAAVSTFEQETSTSKDDHESAECSPATNDNNNTESIQQQWNDDTDISQIEPEHHRHTDTATFDFVGMTSILFDTSILPQYDQHSDRIPSELRDDSQKREQHDHVSITYNHPFTKLVLSIYYVNLFLVLGNYILVMSHAVTAMAGENNICLPTAGIIASTLMFGFSQLRTMANLGRSVSAVSLLALFIVVIQCLYALRSKQNVRDMADNVQSVGALAPEMVAEATTSTNGATILSKMSSLASIGFAVGSQKLLLNIRHEMADRSKAAPQSLSIALATYGLAYILVCLLAGPTPPLFLFDAIPIGSARRIAGLLLWIHVAVSYAINSQALCSSLDRMAVHSRGVGGIWGLLEDRHRIRWLILTGSVAVTSYFVANAVPFFKDLVALCGALTSVPLTLLLPAIFYRRIQCIPLFLPTLHSICSYALLLFSLAFMTIGLIGAVGSIGDDWKHKTGVFSCN